MKHMNVADARANFASLEEAVKNEDVVVTKHGKPIFRITNTPVPEPSRRTCLGDLLAALKDWVPLDEEGREVVRSLNEDRGRMPPSPWGDDD